MALRFVYTAIYNWIGHKFTEVKSSRKTLYKQCKKGQNLKYLPPTKILYTIPNFSYQINRKTGNTISALYIVVSDVIEAQLEVILLGLKYVFRYLFVGNLSFVDASASAKLATQLSTHNILSLKQKPTQHTLTIYYLIHLKSQTYDYTVFIKRYVLQYLILLYSNQFPLSSPTIPTFPFVITSKFHTQY